MTWYSYPTNITSYTDIFIYNNVNSGGLFGIVILIAVFVISFTSMKNFPTEKSFTASSGITALSSALFWVMNLATVEIVTLFSVIFFGSVLFLKSKDEQT